MTLTVGQSFSASLFVLGAIWGVALWNLVGAMLHAPARRARPKDGEQHGTHLTKTDSWNIRAAQARDGGTHAR